MTILIGTPLKQLLLNGFSAYFNDLLAAVKSK
jgi:hypothetical protein